MSELAELKRELEVLNKLLAASTDALEEQKSWIEIAAPVMNWLAEDECQFDHHGFCQTHGPMRDGKCLVMEWRNKGGD